MKLITRQSLASVAAESFKRVYCKDEEWRTYDSWSPVEKHRQLLELGPNPDPDEVDRVMGSTWTKHLCDECRNRSEGPWLELGQEPDYESRTAWICSDCLEQASNLLHENTHQA